MTLLLQASDTVDMARSEVLSRFHDAACIVGDEEAKRVIGAVTVEGLEAGFKATQARQPHISPENLHFFQPDAAMQAWLKELSAARYSDHPRRDLVIRKCRHPEAWFRVPNASAGSHVNEVVIEGVEKLSERPAWWNEG